MDFQGIHRCFNSVHADSPTDVSNVDVNSCRTLTNRCIAIASGYQRRNLPNPHLVLLWSAVTDGLTAVGHERTSLTDVRKMLGIGIQHRPPHILPSGPNLTLRWLGSDPFIGFCSRGPSWDNSSMAPLSISFVVRTQLHGAIIIQTT